MPTRYGFRECVIKGFVDEVVILVSNEEIARHTRSYERGGFVFDPLHYLALIEQKPGALDQAAPLQNWNLPKEFAHLRRVLEARMGAKGKREFIQVLRLLETFPEATVATAVSDAIRLGAPGVRRRQAADPVPHREAPAALGPRRLSLSAEDECWNHTGRRLCGFNERRLRTRLRVGNRRVFKKRATEGAI